MKPFFSSLLTIFLSVLLFSSCEKLDGVGPVVSERRLHTGFESVDIRTPGNVKHTVGAEYRVIIHSQQNIIDVLQTRLNGTELIIKLKDGVQLKRGNEIDIEIQSPVLKSVFLGGAGNVELLSDMNQNSITFHLAGSGNITAQDLIIGDRLRATLSGSGNIILRGSSADVAWYKISGSGNIEAENVIVRDGYAEISGSGNIRVHASESLEAIISGSGSIRYRGNPQIDPHITGSGSLTRY